jgi:hypothetical protein
VVGDYIYFQSGIFSGTAQVAVVGSSGVTSGIIVDFVVTTYAVQLGGFLNFITARANYYIETIIYDVTIVPTYEAIGTSINKPSGSGLVVVDVSAFLKTIVAYNDTFQYDQLNKTDEGQGAGFNIIYRECWDGTFGTWSGLSSTLLYYYVNSAKQIQQSYGSNMGDYVPFITANPNEQKAKFMSDFAKPTYFIGYPFSLSFIYSDAITGYEINKFEETKDLNGGTIATNSFELDNSFAQKVNRLLLANDYDCSIKEVDVWLESAGVSCQQYVVEDYVADGYVEEICGLPEISLPIEPPVE